MCSRDYIAVSDVERVAIDDDVQAVLSSLRVWTAFGERVRAAFPDHVVWDESGPFFEPGFRFSVADRDYVHPSSRWRDPVVCCVSVLAPVYVLYSYIVEDGGSTRVRYSAFPERYQERISTLSELAEECFGFLRLDEETVCTRVPDVAPFGSNRPMSETTLMDCLFLSHP